MYYLQLTFQEHTVTVGRRWKYSKLLPIDSDVFFLYAIYEKIDFNFLFPSSKTM